MGRKSTFGSILQGPQRPAGEHRSSSARWSTAIPNKLLQGLVMCAALCAAEVVTFPTQLRAQSVELGVTPAPYFAGVPIEFQVQVSGVEGAAKPVCRYVGPSDAPLQVAGPLVNTSSYSQMQIINGSVSRKESVTYTFTFQLTASSAGEFQLGPFEVELDGKTTSHTGPKVEFTELAEDPDLQISITIDDNPIYVGQEVPVTVRWAFSGGVEGANHAFNNLRIRSPLFDQFEFKPETPTSRQTLTFATEQGDVAVDGKVSKATEDGKDFIVVTAERTMIPQQVGEFTDIPVSCRTEKVVRWRRGMFGDSRPGAVQPAIASGPPVSLTIKPLPTEGRPVSFSGAVGSGFSLEVTANRSVVRVGDPIALDLKLRGNGNLEKLGLPDLSKCGLDEQQFQLPGELPAGSFNSNVKQFKLNVRVKEESVAQIPAIEFSWFNPKTARYETTRSNPIALQALAAHIVSAADVVSHSPQAADAAQEAESNPGAPRISGGAPLSLVGANLAIPNDPLQLLQSSSNFLSARWTPPLLYLAGLGLVAGAILVRWNSTRDPQLVERKQLQKRWRSRLRIAEDEPPALAAQTIASVLREFQTTTSPSNRVPIERLIADCETIAYSPDSANQTHEMQRIRQAAKAIVEGVE